MAFSFQPFFPQSVQSISLANTLTTSVSNVVVGGVNGTKIEALVVTSTDTIDHAITIAINTAGVLANVANVNIPAGSGATLGVLPVNLFANNQFAFLPQDANGNKYLYLANASCGITWISNSAVASAKAVGIGGQASVF
jgi:hypothetical protein